MNESFRNVVISVSVKKNKKYIYIHTYTHVPDCRVTCIIFN